jgi:CheY-like chemotaxis protein
MTLRFDRPVPFNPSNLNFLVADDHDYTRTIIAEILRGAGVREIVGVSNGFELLEELPRVQPKMLIIDWAMDGMDGNELTRIIRKGSKKFRDIPIIMMSGESRRSQLELARDSGVDEYVAKPISSYSIISRVRQLAQHPRVFIHVQNYAGPCRRRIKPNARIQLRRVTDPHPEFSPESSALQQRAAGIVADAHQKALELNPLDRAQLFEIYRFAQEARSAALASSDDHLMRALQSLLRYLEGTGASGRMNADILGAHLVAIEEIIAMPAHQIEQRNKVMDRLEHVVNGTLRAA